MPGSGWRKITAAGGHAAAAAAVIRTVINVNGRRRQRRRRVSALPAGGVARDERGGVLHREEEIVLVDRAIRGGELVELAEQTVAKVREEGAPVSLDPMSPFERKVVHDAVAEQGLTSESEGVEPRRFVVVLPR